MRAKHNFLTFTNDEAEMTKKMMGYDADQKLPDFKFDNLGNQVTDSDKPKTFL